MSRDDHAHGAGTVAAIDLGTNTALLLVARLGPAGRLEVVEELCRTPRLGEGVAARGSLAPEARERALEVLREYAARVAEHGVAPGALRAVGTAVLRRARDGGQFAREAARATGIPLEVASEAEEARLGEVAVAAEGGGPDTVVIDVGGGSVEVACAALALRASAPVGAVVLAETWLADPPLRPGGWRALCEDAARAVEAFPAGCAAGRAVLALGGTALNLACLAGGFGAFDPRAAEGAVLEPEAARTWAERLAGEDPLVRRLRPIEPERAEILPAGLAVLAATLERLAAGRLRVSGRGLRYGIARELLGRLGRP